MPRRGIDILKQRYAVVEIAIGRTAPRHRHRNMGVGGFRHSRSRHATAVAGQNGNVVTHIAEKSWRHDRKRNGIDLARGFIGDAYAGRLLIVPR